MWQFIAQYRQIHLWPSTCPSEIEEVGLSPLCAKDVRGIRKMD